MEETDSNRPGRENGAVSLTASISRVASAAIGFARAEGAVEVHTPKLEVVRDLARSMARRLETLSRIPADDVSAAPVVEAARTCGDLSTLAACNADLLRHGGDARRVVEAAGEATRAIRERLETMPGERDPARATFLTKDAASAAWKASLAADQMEQ